MITVTSIECRYMIDFLLGLFPKIIKILLFASMALLRAAYSSESWYLEVFIYILLGYAFFDLLITIANDVNDYLKEKRLKRANVITAEERKEARKDREANEKFREEFRKKEKSGKLLGTLIHESLIKESDILSVAKTAEYYQLVVYSAGYGRILTGAERSALTKKQKEKLSDINRKYPEFLKELGFVRIGPMRSTTFVINKAYLHKKFRDIGEFKKYLMVELEKIRKGEWQRFLEVLKTFRGANQRLHTRYESDFRDDHLPINFLLTGSVMNGMNVGMVRGKHIGLAPVAADKEFSVQLMAGARIKDIKLIQAEKIRIRDFFKKTDITFLIGQMEERFRKKIVKNERKIKDRFDVEYILDFANINEKDFQEYLGSLGIDQDGIAKTIIRKARQYKGALEDWNIRLTG